MDIKKHRKFSGFAIALAWPETYCKTVSEWYDVVTKATGYLKNGYYMAGHAAILLIEKDSGKCFYYDFGRYHAPFMHGRVRSGVSDYELSIESTARFSKSESSIDNLDEILHELQSNKACHGDGTLYASLSEIDFGKAKSKADHMQEIGPIRYGPYIPKGTNCSRFVYSVLMAGVLDSATRWKLRVFKPTTPSPMSNIRANGKTIVTESIRPGLHPFTLSEPGADFMKSTLPPPPRPTELPVDTKWISGEGSGSWFQFETPETAHVLRYAPNGDLESTMDPETFYKYWGSIIAGRC